MMAIFPQTVVQRPCMQSSAGPGQALVPAISVLCRFLSIFGESFEAQVYVACSASCQAVVL